jgi:hypothetical protein
MGEAYGATPVIRDLEMPRLVRRDSDVIAPDVGHAGRYVRSCYRTSQIMSTSTYLGE